MTRLTICCLTVLTIALAAPVSALPPSLINYQGVITDSEGRAIDGLHDLTFKIYEDSLNSVPLLWTELHGQVPVTAGLFDVILGRNTAFPQDLFESEELWLGITVEGDSEITPRMRMTSSPSAIFAALADSALKGGGGPDDDWTIAGTNMHAAVPGSIGVGTSDPLAKLHVMSEDQNVVPGVLGHEDLLGDRPSIAHRTAFDCHLPGWGGRTRRLG
ncbi:hypothetical protein ACFL6M_06985 [Candidatus Eisenbacteria bacterium]|uniref:Uncharacterized protein n=1 Tax=Eiseniibacteriota bacterium TaxID=2212470 RepID=A0ABV6YLW9_UNCEI